MAVMVRAAGGADVVDDDDLRAGLEEAFDAAAGAVGLFRLADEEAVDEGGLGAGILFGVDLEVALERRDLVVVGERPGAGGGDVARPADRRPW